MKYFIDTEFAEKPNTIDLISIGIKCEDGRMFYAENMDFNKNLANYWVEANVLPKLRWHNLKFWNGFTKVDFDNPKDIRIYGSLIDIRCEILDFIGKDIPEFWGYYSAYDWVVFCWLFGAMVDLPKGWPMYYRDLKQFADMQIPIKPPFPEPENKHDALTDAIWNEEYYQYLIIK